MTLPKAIRQVNILNSRIKNAIPDATCDYRPEKPVRTLVSMSEFERTPRESLAFLFLVRAQRYSVLAGRQKIGRKRVLASSLVSHK